MIKIKINIPYIIKFLFISFISISVNSFAATCHDASNWCYEQSPNQCFYHFEDVQLTINGLTQNLDTGSYDGNLCSDNDCDIIGAFVTLESGEEICIGWNYQSYEHFNIYQVPVMGIDADNGEIPIFKIWDASESISYNAMPLDKELFDDDNENGCWDEGEFVYDDNENGYWDPSVIPGFANNAQHFLNELKGSDSQQDCNGDDVNDACSELPYDTIGCATFDDCNICSGGDTCIELTLINDDEILEGPFADCAGVCFGDSFIGDCGACLASDNDSDVNIDCNGDCHPSTPIGCSGDEDCGLKEFDSLYFEYELESNGCCNPINMSVWYDDADQDMLGDPDLEYNLCLPDAISRSITQNNYDLYPECFSNSVDECGVCDGFNLDMDCNSECFGLALIDLCGVCNENIEDDNLSCTGCTDSDALNFDPESIFYDGSCYFEVWPGDTDVSGTVGPGDIIPIGIFWGEIGSPRTIESGNDYTWQEQIGYDNWNNKMALFADANGDGIVDIFDVLVIFINWGEIVLSESYNTNINSFYNDIELELYRENFQEIYNNLPEGNNPIQLFLEEIFGFNSMVELPQDYKLHQNRPNPFNPTTNIIYEIPVASNIQIIITNVLGEVVNQYEKNIESPGIYNFEFDGSSLPSGIYIYHLQTSSGINITNKMMLVK